MARRAQTRCGGSYWACSQGEAESTSTETGEGAAAEPGRGIVSCGISLLLNVMSMRGFLDRRLDDHAEFSPGQVIGMGGSFVTLGASGSAYPSPTLLEPQILLPVTLWSRWWAPASGRRARPAAD